MLLIGRPMLSTIVVDFAGRDDAARIAFSISANWFAVSSTRVPTGTRACIRIWPPSTDGKKLRPRNGTSANEATTNARKPVTNTRAMQQRQLEQLAIAARACARSAPRSRAGSAPADCAAATRAVALVVAVRRMRLQQVVRHRRHQRARQDERARPSRTSPPRPSARTGSARRLRGRTSARTRCRCTAARRRPASRSARRRP